MDDREEGEKAEKCHAEDAGIQTTNQHVRPEGVGAEEDQGGDQPRDPAVRGDPNKPVERATDDDEGERREDNDGVSDREAKPNQDARRVVEQGRE